MVALPAIDGAIVTSEQRSAHQDALPATSAWDDANAQLFSSVQEALRRRINVSPRRLVEPGPSPSQLKSLLALAATAPDHGQITPWRLVLIPNQHRALLGEAFASALLGRCLSVTLDQIEAAREKARRAPVLMLAIARLGAGSEAIPDTERLVSLGAAIQGLMLGATAMGFGSGLVSGQAMDSAPIRQLFALKDDEIAVCFVSLGSESGLKKKVRVRPSSDTFFSVLNPDPHIAERHLS
jgi:nitroreductase